MARDNKQLGTFRLEGIPAAPRGIPQIKVTYSIDSNGIVHVSAKDMGTGKEQTVTITASTNMSKEDIDRAVKDAEAFAEEDKKRREEVEVRNNGDQMVYQTEKFLSEQAANVSADDKSRLQSKVDALKEALKGSDTAEIKSKEDDLKRDYDELITHVYQQAAQAQQAQAPDMGGQSSACLLYTSKNIF